MAATQHGVVEHWQLIGVGLTRRQIEGLVARGWLIPLHRCVYAVGHAALTPRSHSIAAVLAVGGDAVLSDASAAALHEFRSRVPGLETVSAPRRVRSRPGIRVRFALLDPGEVVERHGIPVTTPGRTLLDLAATCSPEDLERCYREAVTLRLVGPAELALLTEAQRGRRGVGRLRALLARENGIATVTRSELERRFLNILDRDGLPRPETNVRLDVRGELIEVDCLWRDRGLVVELDGWAFHSDRHSHDRDRRRDRLLKTVGMDVTRVTWTDLHPSPHRLLTDLHLLLAASPSATFPTAAGGTVAR